MDALLDAFHRLRLEFPALRLALFGKTGISEARSEWFEHAISAHGLSEAVVRLGFVNDLELADLYRSATMFVFPSLYEGFGLPLLEAMSVGACVVARNASSMAEVVGDAGVLVETAQGASLADGLRHLLSDPAERARLGAQARHRASTFTLERLARQTFEAYEAVAGTARRAPPRR
jgi:glycosyltransferase involved in cell wall biosynthesis